MRYTVPHRSILVALCMLSVGLLGSTPPAGAQTASTVIGEASAVQATVSAPLGSTTTVLADTGALAGTTDARDASALAGSVPALLNADVLHATTIGYPDEVDSDVSITDVTVGVAGTTVSADFVMAQATAVLGTSGTSTTGTFEIDNLAINGVTVSISGTANQTIAIPGGKVVANEQQRSSTGMVVNALHVTVYGVADVVIGSATAGIQ